MISVFSKISFKLVNKIIPLILLVVIVYIFWGIPRITKHKIEITKSTIHSLQVALIRCEVDRSEPIYIEQFEHLKSPEVKQIRENKSGKVHTEGFYPLKIESLIEEGYVTQFPINPYTKKQVQNIELGSEPFKGEFTYIPVVVDDSCIGFYLIGYGDENSPGTSLDDVFIDHSVIIVYRYAEYYSARYYPEFNEVIERYKFEKSGEAHFTSGNQLNK